MKITEKLAKKNVSFGEERAPTIAFLGDSVTHGCFELYIKLNGNHETYVDLDHSYQADVAKILHLLYPGCPVNIVNAGVSGTTAENSYPRLERDVLSYRPDLVVVCFALNDSTRGRAYRPTYMEYLGKIVDDVKASGAEVIVMTPNMMATELSPKTAERNIEKFTAMANQCMRVQNGGDLDFFVEGARKVAKEHGARLCDVYAKWKSMFDAGVNVTELLSNQINHPVREMHWLFAESLVEEILR